MRSILLSIVCLVFFSACNSQVDKLLEKTQARGKIKASENVDGNKFTGKTAFLKKHLDGEDISFVSEFDIFSPEDLRLTIYKQPVIEKIPKSVRVKLSELTGNRADKEAVMVTLNSTWRFLSWSDRRQENTKTFKQFYYCLQYTVTASWRQDGKRHSIQVDLFDGGDQLAYEVESAPGIPVGEIETYEY
ncbi:MAG: hypothetical protein MK193_07310 [Lentisphaeria bacterium]|nr:hypothetical protein [Lentisphaeria bacterium]